MRLNHKKRSNDLDDFEKFKLRILRLSYIINHSFRCLRILSFAANDRDITLNTFT
jgi:hypothetical protein